MSKYKQISLHDGFPERGWRAETRKSVVSISSPLEGSGSKPLTVLYSGYWPSSDVIGPAAWRRVAAKLEWLELGQNYKNKLCNTSLSHP